MEILELGLSAQSVCDNKCVDLSPPSPSYYFEPIWQHKLSCASMMNNTKVVGDIETIIGGLLKCYSPTVKQLKRETNTMKKKRDSQKSVRFYEDSHSGKTR